MGTALAIAGRPWVKHAVNCSGLMRKEDLSNACKDVGMSVRIRFCLSPGCADDHQGSTSCQIFEGQALRKRSCKNQSEVQWLSMDRGYIGCDFIHM